MTAGEPCAVRDRAWVPESRAQRGQENNLSMYVVVGVTAAASNGLGCLVLEKRILLDVKT